MMEEVSRGDVQRLIRRNPDLTIVEVLPPASYRQFHLPRAINVPWSGDYSSQRRFTQQIQNAVPLKKSPVVIYCQDSSDSILAQAARCMEEIGFRQVYGYRAGKADWKNAGLPIEA